MTSMKGNYYKICSMCYNNLYKDISFDFLRENCTRSVHILYKIIRIYNTYITI